jgi:putative ABC transport system ATP-binding protein
MYKATRLRQTRQPIISARGLTRVFGAGESAVVAVLGIDLDVYTQEFLSVTGRSGSGKTTLLNLMAGLDRPTSGSVLIDGLDLATLPEVDLVELRRRTIGFVFQSFGLIPLLSAQENVELPLHINGISWRERRGRALEALELVGLGPRAHHRPYELSGGEQQRVAIARALVNGPGVVFADEPTAELDSATAMSIAAILRDIAINKGVAVIVATHDLTLARMADRSVNLVDGVLHGVDEAPHAASQ